MTSRGPASPPFISTDASRCKRYSHTHTSPVSPSSAASGRGWIFDRGQGAVECVDDKWLVQNPAMNGYTAIQAYLPTRRIALALTVTKGQAATATRTDYSQELFKSILEDPTPDPQVLFPEPHPRLLSMTAGKSPLPLLARTGSA